MDYAVIESEPDGTFRLVGPFGDELAAAEWARTEHAHGRIAQHLVVPLTDPWTPVQPGAVASQGLPQA